MTGIVYTTSSLILTALDQNPLNTINLQTMNLLLTQLEFTLSAFASHRVRQLQTPQALITEIDNYAVPETPLLFCVKFEHVPQSQNGHVFNHDNPRGPPSFQKLGVTDTAKGTGHTYPEPETLCPGYAGHSNTPPSEQDYYNAFNSSEGAADPYATPLGTSMFAEMRDGGFSTPLGQVTGEVKQIDNLSYNTRTLLKASRSVNTGEVRAYGNLNGHVSGSSAAILEQKKLLVEKAAESAPKKGLSLETSPFMLVSFRLWYLFVESFRKLMA